MAAATAKQDIAVGVFRSEAAARQAVAQLRAEGFDEADITLVAETDNQRNEPGEVSDKTITRSNGGLAVGALIGAVVGIFVGVVLSSGLVPLPDLVRNVGTLGMILAGAAIGAALGALGGSMAGMTQTRQETKGLEKAVEAGGWLVSLISPDADAARMALRKVGATDLRVQSPTPEPVRPKTT